MSPEAPVRAPVPADDPALRRALRLVQIVSERQSEDWRLLDAAIEGGVSAFWLRMPGATGAKIYRQARGLVTRATAAGVSVIVGDRADVALAVGASGVQLGVRSPPPSRIRPWFPGWIGASCHSESELARAEQAGCDYLVLSPVFGVPEKGAPLGTAVFGRWAAAVSRPVVALGGVEAANVAELMAAGAAGVAAVRALSAPGSARALAAEIEGTQDAPRD